MKSIREEKEKMEKRKEGKRKERQKELRIKLCWKKALIRKKETEQEVRRFVSEYYSVLCSVLK